MVDEVVNVNLLYKLTLINYYISYPTIINNKIPILISRIGICETLFYGFIDIQ